MDSPLISPSKARRDAVQAKDWSYVSNWLAKKYAPQPVPRFERNHDVLRELLALVAANDASDGEVELLHRARTGELEQYEAAQDHAADDPIRDLLAEVEESLDQKGTDALRDLAETCVALGTLDTDPVTLEKRTVDLATEEFDRAEELRKVGDLQAYLERETASLKAEMQALQDSREEGVTEHLQQQTTQWNRDTKQIGMKLAEYKERIAALERVKVVGPSIEDVKFEEQEAQALQARIKGLERQLNDYHGLPPDLEASKEEYQRSQRELQTLTRRRDELWERLVQSR